MPALPFLSSPGACVVKHIPYMRKDWSRCLVQESLWGLTVHPSLSVVTGGCLLPVTCLQCGLAHLSLPLLHRGLRGWCAG